LFGVGAGCFEQLLSARLKVTTLTRASTSCSAASIPNRSEKLRKTRGILKKHPHDICLVTDGDADRVAAWTGTANIFPHIS